MKRLGWIASLLTASLLPAVACLADGLESAGNTDGHVTWRLGELKAGRSAGRVVILAWADSHEKLLKLLDAARPQLSKLPAAPEALADQAGKPGKAGGVAWIANSATDFALEPSGCFYWEGGRQSLRCPAGGQLSRFAWYVHYNDGSPRRAGTPITDQGSLDNLRVVEPVRAVAKAQALGLLATADGVLRIRLRAVMGQGPVAAVEIVVTNASPGSVRDVALSVYANLEANHDHENDYATLDARAQGLLTVDPPTGVCAVLAGVEKPSGGYSGQWPSEAQLQSGAGEPVASWKPFAGLSAAAKKRPAGTQPPRDWGIYNAHAPAPDVEPTEPPTRTLTPAEADEVLVNDWLFQAEGRPPADRARHEIAWARQLAERLREDPRTPDLTGDLRELDALAARCGLPAPSGPRRPARDAKGLPAGLIARWTFDNCSGRSAPDASGKGPRGTLSARAQSVPGVFGDALDLGGGASIDVGSQLAAITKGSYTVCAWIKTTSQEADILGNGTTAGHFLFMAYNGVLRGHQWTGAGGNVLDGRAKVADGRWHHVAQIVDDSTISLFVDGRPDTTRKFLGVKSSADSAVTIGGRGQAGGGTFAGVLDELCVFGRALSGQEIQAEFDAGKVAQRAAEPPPSPDDLKARDLYLAVRRLKRRITLKNPAVDFRGVLLIDNPFPQGREWPHQARHRDGMMAVPGGRLLVLEGLAPGGAVRKLAGARPASFWRPDLSFDARRVLFCMKPHDEKSFHLYEINVDPGAPGAMRQLTHGDYDDTDPIYLPDGHVLFSTTRCNTYVRCMPYTYAYVLARCDADGGNIYFVSRNNEPDWCPALLNDGRVIYSRWEYHDKALWRIQSLWTINQDGTNVATFWGNQSVWPDHLAEPRPIPGSNRVMFTGVAHHNWFAGSIGILDQDKGYNFPYGLTKVTAEAAWPECGRPPVDPIESPRYHTAGRFQAYKTPYPLSESDFLVSAWSSGNPRGDRFRLYLMDIDGNRELIYEGHYNVWHAMPLKARTPPPAHADRVAWPRTPQERLNPRHGVLYSTNVSHNVPDLPAGKVRYLRVLQMDARTYSTWARDGRFSGPVVSGVQDDGVKRILGTVPVAPDGSVSFQVPPGKALHFQLLDERFRALQTMRSFTGVMPGEIRGCVGCHELHSVTPVNQGFAARRDEAPALDPPPWGTRSISYERMVQPVLDRYCGKCHQGDGHGRAKLDLTLRPGRGPFKEPYLTLIGYANYNNVGIPPGVPGIAGAMMCENFAQSDPASYVTFRPMRYLSCTSKLIEIASGGKGNDVKGPPAAMHRGGDPMLAPADLRVLIGWVDANCPYRSDEDVREIPDPSFGGIEKLPIRPRVRTAPVIPRP